MTLSSRALPLLLALAAAPLASGCSASYNDFGTGGGGDFGVTPGGAQDLRFARERIEAGFIPDASAYRVEGIFSEHDLPITSDAACDRLLCPRTSVARMSLLDGSGERLLIQLGFATNVDPETFTRRPLDLALAVDISGSMTGEKLDSVKEALTTMAEQMNEGDRVSLIAFDDEAELRLKPRVMDAAGRDALKKAIDALETDGGTNIEAGLALAYAQIAGDVEGGVEDRVMLLTDAQPNVGATETGSFMDQVRERADQGIGLSVFGVGLDLGAELAQEISTVRGGNYFYLADAAAIAAVFDDEFDMMVTPLAYDLEVQVATASGWTFAEAFGAPLDQPGTEVDFGASTLFLSKRRGGMGLALRPGEGGTLPASAEALANFDLSYLPVDAAAPVADSIAVPWQGGAPYQTESVAADDVGVLKMAALIDEYMALQAGSAFCEGSLAASVAIERIKLAADHLDETAALLSDEPLAAEAALMGKLAENVEGGSGQCDTTYYL